MTKQDEKTTLRKIADWLGVPCTNRVAQDLARTLMLNSRYANALSFRNRLVALRDEITSPYMRRRMNYAFGENIMKVIRPIESSIFDYDAILPGISDVIGKAENASMNEVRTALELLSDTEQEIIMRLLTSYVSKIWDREQDKSTKDSESPEEKKMRSAAVALIQGSFMEIYEDMVYSRDRLKYDIAINSRIDEQLRTPLP